MDHFTRCAEKVFDQAELYALKGGNTIDSVHLLAALCAVEEGYASQILLRFGFTRENAESFLLQTSINEVNRVAVSPVCRQIVSKAILFAKECGFDEADTEHILLSLCFYRSCFGAKILGRYKISFDEVLSVVNGMAAQKDRLKKPSINRVEENTERSFDGKNEQNDIEHYGEDLIRKAQKGLTEPVIGREKETERLMRILARKNKNNAILVGESGVGKTAVVEGLAQRIAKGDVPDFFKKKRIVSLDINSLVSGTRYRGDLEEKVTKLFDVTKNDENLILFIDEIHSVMTMGGSDGGNNIASLFKPALGHKMTVVGATTFSEYKKFLEKDPAFERRFTKLVIEEPDVESSIRMLESQKSGLEEHYRVHITGSAIESAVELSKRYIADRFLPDKAIDLMEETCGNVTLRSNKTVTKRDIQTVLAEITGIPTSTVCESMQDKLMRMEEILSSEIIGQSEAVAKVAATVRRAYAGITERKKPIACLMFIGPTGVGKTQTAKTLAKVLFGSENDMIRFDMSEFSEKNSVSKLIGSAPGYVGYEEGGRLTDEVRKKPFSVVLFDEIEKAHGEIFHLLLSMLDDGRLTDGKGRTVDFCNTIIIMTGNVGTKESEDIRQIGFFGVKNGTRDESYKKQLETVFPPEFINRLDSIIVFNKLFKEDLKKISNNIMKGMKESLKKQRGITLTIDDNVCEYLAEETEDEKYGARPLKRMIENLEDSIGLEIIGKNLKNCEIVVRIQDGKPKIICKGV